MTNSKNTKRALLASVLSVVLCFAMLVGSTFAWFTDSASTGVNKIVAGNLAIDLVDESGNSLEGKTLGWVAYDGREQEAILWEPGCTYNMEPFYIKNNGNLNLKFKFSVSGIQGDAKLLEAIDFTAMADAGWFKFNTGAVSIETEGEFDLFKGFDVDTLFYGTKHFDEYVLEPGQTVGPIVISGHMKEEAGNEYRGLSIDGIAITLVATQATGEEDSFNGVYDADAEYPVAADVEGLQTMLADAKPGDTVLVGSAFTGVIEIPEGLKDVTIVSMGAKADKIVLNQDNIDNVTFDGFSFDRTDDNDVTIKLTPDKTIGAVTFKNCSITGKGQKVTDGLSGKNRNTDITFEGCTFSGVGRPVYDEFGGIKSLTLKDCLFTNDASDGMSWVATLQGKVDSILIDGCRFVGRKEGLLKMSGGCDSFTFTNNVLEDCGEHPSRGMFEGTPLHVTWENNTFNSEDYINPFAG